MQPSDGKLEPVVVLLFCGMLIFTGILLYVQKFSPNDGQTFQVIAGLLTAFSGAFFMRVKPRGVSNGDPSGAPPLKTEEPKSNGSN